MKNIVRAEWQRLWNQKITWISLILIPFILIFAAKLHQNRNEHLAPNHPNYAYANNFLIFSMYEQMTIVLNIVVLLIVVLHVAYEYHSGQMRFILQRTITFPRLIFAKWLTISLFLALFLFVYFICSIIIGFIYFEYSPQLTLLHRTEPAEFTEVLIYSLSYYGLAFVTLVTMASVMMTLCLISKSTTGAIGLTVGFVLFSFIYPNIILLFFNHPFAGVFVYSSLVVVQFEGISLMLTGELEAKILLLTVILIYLVMSNFISNLLARKREHYI